MNDHGRHYLYQGLPKKYKRALSNINENTNSYYKLICMLDMFYLLAIIKGYEFEEMSIKLNAQKMSFKTIELLFEKKHIENVYNNDDVYLELKILDLENNVKKKKEVFLSKRTKPYTADESGLLLS